MEGRGTRTLQALKRRIPFQGNEWAFLHTETRKGRTFRTDGEEREEYEVSREDDGLQQRQNSLR